MDKCRQCGHWMTSHTPRMVRGKLYYVCFVGDCHCEVDFSEVARD